MEPLPAGLKRLTTRELESAASRFYDGEEEFPSAVHEARKATKRVRAVLRMVRFEVGEQVFAFEDGLMRDTARMIAPVRDTRALVESIDVLARVYGHLLADGVLDEARQVLDLTRERTETIVMEDPETILTVVENFERAHSRYSDWPVEPSARNIYGVGVRDSFEAVAPGLSKTYSQGRKRMVYAYGSPSSVKFHDWRKSVKYLRHQMELLTPLWPEVVVGMAITLERVGELLGQDHDLSMLTEKLQTDNRVCPEPARRSLITALANQRRSDLQTAARVLGRRVFAEGSEAITGRFGAYWESREPDAITALDSVNL
jgi:CHAD domain-containing protein